VYLAVIEYGVHHDEEREQSDDGSDGE